MTDAEIYRGTALQQFIIDRAALGLDADSIRAEFEALHKMVPAGFDKEFINNAIKVSAPQIAQRETQLVELYSSTNLLSRLNALHDELVRVKAMALEDNDLRTYALLASQLLKSLELFQKSVTQFKEREESRLTLIQNNNYYIFEDLKKHGFIEITNPDGLKKLVGADDAKEEQP